MNYESERRSLEDLKQQARQQSQAAGKSGALRHRDREELGGAFISAADSGSTVEQILKAQAALATRRQMEDFPPGARRRS